MDDLTSQGLGSSSFCQLHDIGGIWGDIIVMAIWRVVEKQEESKIPQNNKNFNNRSLLWVNKGLHFKNIGNLNGKQHYTYFFSWFHTDLPDGLL